MEFEVYWDSLVYITKHKQVLISRNIRNRYDNQLQGCVNKLQNHIALFINSIYVSFQLGIIHQ